MGPPFLSRNSLMPERKSRCFPPKIPLCRSRNSLVTEVNFPCKGAEFPSWRAKSSRFRKKIHPYNPASQPFAPGGMSHSINFFEKTRPVVCWYAESPYLCTRFPEGRRFPRGGAGRNEKRGRGKKKFGGFAGNPYLCSPFPPGVGGEPRGMAAASGGGTQGERSLKELEARDKRRPPCHRGAGGASRGCVPRAGKIRKSQFLQRRV